MKAFLVLIILFPFYSFSQPLFSTARLNDAFALAAKNHKLVLVQYESSVCASCNDEAYRNLNDASIRDSLVKYFVTLRIGPSHPDREKVATEYNMRGLSGLLFLRPDRSPVFVSLKSNETAASYIADYRKALIAYARNPEFNLGDNNYSRVTSNRDSVAGFLVKRANLNLVTDNLLDAFALAMPSDPIEVEKTYKLLAILSPVLGTVADSVWRTDAYLFNRSWYPMPLSKRVELNTEIIRKSLSAAIEERNEDYAMKVASFAQSTFVNDYQGGLKVYQGNMVEFYRGIRDTVAYITSAIAYYDKYYMNLSADSIRKAGSALQIANQLNYAAEGLISFSKDEAVLNKALLWNTKSLAFAGTGFAHITQSKIYLLQGKKKEAAAEEKLAITYDREKAYNRL